MLMNMKFEFNISSLFSNSYNLEFPFFFPGIVTSAFANFVRPQKSSDELLDGSLFDIYLI